MAENNSERSGFCINAEAYINEQRLNGFVAAKLPNVDPHARKKNMRLTLMFMNIRDAVSVLRNIGEQHIQIAVATECWNIENAKPELLAERHIMIATPKMLIPNCVNPLSEELPSCVYDVVYYAVHVDSEKILEADSRNGTCWIRNKL